MLIRKTTVQASNEQVALAKAAKLMGTAPENVQIEQSGADTFAVSMRNADAEVEVALSEDKYEAVITQAEHGCGRRKSDDL